MRPPILFIAQSAPPRPAAAARRLGQLLRWARQYYRAVYLIRGDRDYPGAEVEGVTVFPIPLRDLRAVAGAKGSAGTLGQGHLPHRLTKPLRHLRQSFPFVLATDDGGVDYRRQAFAVAEELITAHGIRTLVSSFRPWSDHLVARRLKRRFPHLHWIADFRDLPVDPIRRDVWWPGLQRWWSRRVVRAADEVWAVSEGQAAQLTYLRHPAVRVRRSLLERLPPARTAPVTDRFTIVYTGSLYPGLQSLDPLITALLRLIDEQVIDPTNLLLRYAGKDAALFRAWTARLPPACLDIHPLLAPATAQTMQAEAQLLLLLNWSAPGYFGVLTAKLFDYLATGRPILAIVNGPGDAELTEIIEGADAGAVVGEGAGRLEELLRDWYRTWQQEGTLPWRPDRETLFPLLELPIPDTPAD